MPCALPPSLLCRSAFVPRPCVLARFASTRARNLAARHWDLVRSHSPHPAAQHVIDHQATKARIADQTGLKVTTDTVPSSTPKEVFIRGVRIPLRPKPPESDECCMSGCAVCVYDLYLSSLDDYKQELATTVAQLQEQDVPRYEWPDEMRQVEKMEHMKEVEGDPLEELSLDPSMKAFLMLEKKLGQKK